MMDKKEFKKYIANSFPNTLFVKKGQSWYLDGDDCIAVVNLQKSNFSEEYFMNIGIWIKALGSFAFPQINQCHIYLRVERLFPGERMLIFDSLSLERNNLQILHDLSEFIKLKLVPFLKDCTEKSKLRTLVKAGKFKSGIILGEVEDYLN